jgi:hypothetical protein
MWVFDGKGFTMACLVVLLRKNCSALSSAMTMRPDGYDGSIRLVSDSSRRSRLLIRH